MTSVLTVNSQATISTAIRDFLGLEPGERLRFESMPNGRVAMTPVDFAKANANKALASLRNLAARTTPG